MSSTQTPAGSGLRTPARPAASILVVDDEVAALNGVKRALRAHGFQNVHLCSDGREVLSRIAESQVELVLLDLIMPHVRGEEVLGQIAELHPQLPVIVVTAEYEVSTAVRCMKLGASDYLLKPVDGGQLIATVERGLEQSALEYECSRLRERFFGRGLERPETFEEIVTADGEMHRIFGYLEAISRSVHPVLVVGETGTGKELVARALHAASRRDGPFVAVNMGGLDDALAADTLFGHAAGAFTGAATARPGMVERAGEGTLFLDEIGDLQESTQVKLLRLLQEREYYPLGADQPLELRARVIAATNRDPQELRQDLYYRLRSYRVQIPPLRERRGDLPLLVDAFLARAAEDLGKPRPTVPPELFDYLASYDFPGNVRELQAIVFDAVARHEGGVMPIELFTASFAGREDAAPDSPSELRFPEAMPSLRSLEQAAVQEALRRTNGNQSAAARLLGVSRPTIGRHLSR